jgi:type II secretory ATPase GspE/PulE/Tfp pilus assembly ATPase PilB-like protein
LRGPEGLLLVAAPLGAGRPTTLFALAAEMQAIGAQVFVLENSFERRLRGVGRIETKDMGAQAFSTALEHALQMKPEALVVGDLPDKESVEIACRAASSGQRILAASSAPDALSAVSRLLDLGVQPPLLGSALHGVLSQRLVRRICSKCARETQVSFQLRRVLPTHFEPLLAGAFRKGRGCAECHQIGTFGRIGVFEYLEFDEDFRSLVAQRPLPSELRNEAERRAFRGLEQDAFLKASRGLIPADDILSLGGPIALAYDELSKATIALPDLPEDEESMAPSETETSDLVSWDEVAELANLLED